MDPCKPVFPESNMQTYVLEVSETPNVCLSDSQARAFSWLPEIGTALPAKLSAAWPMIPTSGTFRMNGIGISFVHHQPFKLLMLIVDPYVKNFTTIPRTLKSSFICICITKGNYICIISISLHSQRVERFRFGHWKMLNRNPLSC